MRPAIYEGSVLHERRGTQKRRFTYRVAMPMVDLDELEAIDALAPLWRPRGPAIVAFRRRDYMGDVARPLAAVVRDVVEERVGFRSSFSPTIAPGAGASTPWLSTIATRPTV